MFEWMTTRTLNHPPDFHTWYVDEYHLYRNEMKPFPAQVARCADHEHFSQKACVLGVKPAGRSVKDKVDRHEGRQWIDERAPSPLVHR